MTEPMRLIRPDWQAPASVTAFCTTRLGGVSQPPFDGLNLGLHTADAQDSVRENRKRLIESQCLPCAPTWLRQVHGTTVVAAHEARDLHAADGSWTSQPGTVVAVMTADCLPVVLCNATGTRIAVIHAGWRGLAAGVLSSGLALFEPDEALHAWLGPAIGPQAFEVGQEVRDAFVARDDSHAEAFVATGSSGKYLCDLYALAGRELQRDADVSVTGGDHCTFSEPDLFFSHRRDAAGSGRLATVAWLE